MLLSEETSRLYGVHQTPIISQQERTDELNQRMRTRLYHTGPTAPMFSSRPTSTKYDIMSFSSPAPVHNNADQWMARTSGVDTESELRNQIYALQRSSQAVYVPSSNSDLFRDGTTIVKQLNPPKQPYELLFAQPLFDSNFNRWKGTGTNIGVDRFNNSTRTQMRHV